MDKQTLSNYGWVIILTLVLAVMLALATPFGTYVGNGVVSIARGYAQTSDKIMDEDKLNKKSQEWESMLLENDTATSQNEGYNHDDPALHPTDGVWESSRTTPQNDDTYETTDYTYRFNSYYNGWEVSVKDKTKTSYEPICESINNKPIIDMFETFCGCHSLIVAPEIPTSVIYMTRTFEECTSLTVAPSIPSGVTSLMSVFCGCTSLTTAPEIPSGVTDMYGTFSGCSSLTTVQSIPKSIVNMPFAFSECPSLTEITYTGTIAEWNEVDITAWEDIAATIVIHCSDGDINP